MVSNNSLKNSYKQRLKLTLFRICNCTSYKIIRLILQYSDFMAYIYISISIYLYIYIYIIYIYIYIFKCYKRIKNKKKIFLDVAQNQIPTFPDSVQFCLIYLLCSKFFMQDCRQLLNTKHLKNFRGIFFKKPNLKS